MVEACYFLQTHRDPAQISRLVATIKRSSPRAQVWIGHDPRRETVTRDDLPSLPGIHLFHVSSPVERGHLSLMTPYFEAVRRLAEHGVDYDWLVYLSGQDYPLGPLPEFEATLRASGSDGFLRYWEAFQPDNPWGRRRQGIFRYQFAYADWPAWSVPALRMLRVVNRLQSRVHIHTTYGAHVGWRCRDTPFGPDRRCYAGTQWTTLRREAVEFAAAAVEKDRFLVEFFDRTICPDEALVQTILVNARRFSLRDEDHHFTDFRGSRNGSPRTLGSMDYEAMVASGRPFARKFDRAVDPKILDRLDERIFAAAAPG